MIHTSKLVYQYSKHPRGIPIAFPDIEVAQGGILLLRGQSGSGKSTWLALAAGLLDGYQGALQICGQAPSDLKGAALDAWRSATIGFLPQKLHLSEALSVQDNLALVYFAAGLKNDSMAIQKSLAVLGVAELAARKPSALSGGQAQRVALARAVLRSPQLVLADEPTASLDDQAAAQVLGLLQSTASRCKATLVIATHDARLVQALPGAVVAHFSAI